MEKCFLLPCLLLLATSSTVQSQFNTGATTNECVSLQPAGVTPSAGNAPFIVASSSTTYTPGDTTQLQVFIAALGTVNARGLVIQARRASGDTTPVGSFSLPSNNLYRFLTCGTSTTGTLTNTNANQKTLPLVFTWTAPPDNVGDVNFIVSLVETNGNFWSGITSQNSLTASVLSIAPCPTPTLQDSQAIWSPPDCMRGTTVLGNSATCTPPSGSTFPSGDTLVTCTCQDQGESDSCMFTVTVADVCDPNPCQNGGSCIEVPQSQVGFICTCLPGFDPPLCTDGGPGDSCAGNPCSGNECRESPNSLAGYTCHSVTGTPCPQA